MATRALLLVLLALEALLTLGSCSSGGAAIIPFDPQVTTPTTMVTSDGRVTAVIPQGAISDAGQLKLENRSSMDAKVPGPAGRHLVMALAFSVVVPTSPDNAPADGAGGTGTGGTTPTPTLSAAVEMTLKLAPALPPGLTVPLYLYNASSERYEDAALSGQTSDDGTELKFSINAFGRYAFYSLTSEELPPAAPTGLVQLKASTQVRQLRWAAAPAAGLAGYNLHRAPLGQDSFSKVNESPLQETLYSDELPQPGAFRYRLTAVGLNGMESQPSNEIESPAIDFDLTFTFGETILDQPTVLALDSAGDRLIVADQTRHRLSIFSLDGRLVRHVDSYSGKAVLLPRGLCFSADYQRLYVTDASYCECMILGADYSLGGIFGSRGRLAGQFELPTGVAVIGDRVLVADKMRGLLQAFTPLGVYLRTDGAPGSGAEELMGPTALLAQADGGLWIADSDNNRLQALDADLAFATPVVFAVADGGPLSNPTGLAQDFRGWLYVSDSVNRRVVVFDEGGAFLFHFGAPGSRIIEFSAGGGPSGMALDRSSGYLYVCDPGNHRIAVFKS